MERRLAAILAADVANYSLMMNADEGATYRAWRTARADVVDPSIRVANGRIVKHTGDGFLAEFPTVLAAVECAVDIQSAMAEQDQATICGQIFQFRIGINLGDIIVDEEDIHGDGVNIAARLESIAAAGGVCISGDAYHQVRNKPGFSFRDLGERRVKNIRAPLRVFQVVRGEPEIVEQISPVDGVSPEETDISIENILDNISSPVLARTELLVGREKETQILLKACQEAEAKEGNIVLIRGDPGIGKSCLAQYFAAKAQQAGALVTFGQCHETLGSPPFWPWLQILKTLYATNDSVQDTSANIFAGLTVTAASAQNRPQATFSNSGGNEQFLLFNRISNLLAEYACRRNLVIILDDLHWADRSSLLLLTHLCGKLSGQSILVIGTYRDMEVTRKHPLSDTLGAINREAKLRRIALKGLSTEETFGFFKKVVTQELPSGLLQTLHEKTEGNPLFVSEIASILQQEHINLAGGGFSLEIPDGIQEAIGRRLNLLTDECNDLVSTAAVIGRRFSLGVLNHLLPDTDQLTTLKFLEEATNRGIIKESVRGIGEFQFCHVLIRDILYDELSLTRKAVLHSQVADALVQLGVGGGGQALGEIARHYYQAIQAGQSTNALKYALLAAEHANSLSAFDEARDYYESALEVLAIDNDGDTGKRAEILFRIIQCMQGLGAPSKQILPVLERCIDAARTYRHYAIFVEAACYKVYLLRAPSQVREALVTIDEALALLAEDDLQTRANVLAHRAMALTFNGRRHEAEQVAYQAVATAADSGDQHTHCAALCMALLALRGRPEKLSERIHLGEEALALAQDAGDVLMTMDSLEWLILSYQELGNMQRANMLVSQLAASVEQDYRFKASYFAAGASACLALFAGRWTEAEILIEKAFELGSGALDGGAEGVYGAQMFLLNRELGRLPLVHGALQNMLADHRPMWKPGLLATYTDLGLVDQSRSLFDELTADGLSHLVEDEMFLTCLIFLTEACMVLDCSDKAGALYQKLAPYTGQMVSHPTAVCYGPADLYLAMLSSQMNKLSEAEALFARAIALAEKTGANIWYAHSKYRHAQVLSRHHFSRGKSAFHKLLREARTAAEALGMVNLLQKIDKLEQGSSLRGEYASGLSRRELEVLKLIVQGKSNKAIAAELHRSLATIATHVRAILNKTRTANRTEAAAYAQKNNLCKTVVSAGS